MEAREGGLVLSQLQEAGVSCRVVDGPVAASVTFFRVSPLSGMVRKRCSKFIVLSEEISSVSVGLNF